MQAAFIRSSCLVLGLTLAASVPVGASYFQEHCSAADGSVVYAQGHAENFLILTEGVGTDGERRIVLRDPVYDAEVLEEDTLRSREQRTCEPNGGGLGEWHVLRLKRIRFTPRPGGRFPVIETRMFCREEGDSEVLCP